MGRKEKKYNKKKDESNQKKKGLFEADETYWPEKKNMYSTRRHTRSNHPQPAAAKKELLIIIAVIQENEYAVLPTRDQRADSAPVTLKTLKANKESKPSHS